MTEQHNEQQDNHQESASRSCPGQRLQLARESRGLELTDVSAELRLHENQIKALEQCDMQALPGAAFVKGYLRSYCRLLDIPADSIISEYEHFSEGPAPLVGAQMSTELSSHDFPVRMFTHLVIVILLVLLGSWWWSQRDEMTFDLGTQEPDTSSLTLPESTFGGQADALPAGDSVESSAEASGLQGGEATETTLEPADEMIPEVVESTEMAVEPEPEPEPAYSPNELLMSMNADCWTEITDATGKKVYFNLAKAGSKHIVKGTPPFKIFLGYAPGVEMTYMGEPVSFSGHVSGTVARLSVGSAQAE